jgi:hypothetical protein
MRSPRSREHEAPGDLPAAVDVDRADHGLEAVGEDRLLGSAARQLLTPAEPQLAAEVDLAGDRGERRGAHDRGTDLGQLALGDARVRRRDGR